MADPLMPAATPPGPMSLNGRFPMVRLMARGWWMFILRGAPASCSACWPSWSPAWGWR